jgi:hypothetical protein
MRKEQILLNFVVLVNLVCFVYSNPLPNDEGVPERMYLPSVPTDDEEVFQGNEEILEDNEVITSSTTPIVPTFQPIGPVSIY